MEDVKPKPAQSAPLAINPNACLHVRSGTSKCRICQDFCPENCLVVTNGTIAFNASSCVECGICVTVCPSGVFAMTRFTEGRIMDMLDEGEGESAEVRLTCGYKGSVFADEPKPVVPAPCLAILGEAHLVRLALEGSARVILRAPCGGCGVNGGGDVIAWMVDRSTRLLETLGRDPSCVIFEKADDAGPATPSDRRSFLKGVGSRLALTAISRFDKPVTMGTPNGRLPAVTPPARRRKLVNLLSGAAADTKLAEKDSPFRIVTVNSDCVVCWACGSYCPTGALARDEDADGATIRFTAERCVKCFDCAELCPEGAISYAGSFPASAINADAVTLAHRRNRICPACGRPYTPKGDELKCAACAKWEKFQQHLYTSYVGKEVSE